MNTGNERDRHQGMNGTLPRSVLAIAFDSETSSGHFVMKNRFRKMLISVCEWSHNYDESFANTSPLGHV